jgi:hypothetical protein
MLPTLRLDDCTNRTRIHLLLEPVSSPFATVVLVSPEVALNSLPFRSSRPPQMCVESNEDGMLSRLNRCEGFASMSRFQWGGADREPYTTQMVAL